MTMTQFCEMMKSLREKLAALKGNKTDQAIHKISKVAKNNLKVQKNFLKLSKYISKLSKSCENEGKNEATAYLNCLSGWNITLPRKL